MVSWYLSDSLILVFFGLQVLFLGKMSSSSTEGKYGQHIKGELKIPFMFWEKKKVRNVLLNIEVNSTDSINETCIFTTVSSNAYKQASVILQTRNLFLN